MVRYLLPLAVFLGLVGILAMGLSRDPSRVPSPLIGKPTPTFILPKLREPRQSFASEDLRGQVSLLNVWASWCVACRQEHPLLMQLARKDQLPIYGFNYKDERDKALRWLERRGDPYQAIAFDRTGRVGIDLGVYGVPETYVVDKAGVIRYKQIGPLTEAALEEKVLPLIHRLQSKES